jgi:hypothetical protein
MPEEKQLDLKAIEAELMGVLKDVCVTERAQILLLMYLAKTLSESITNASYRITSALNCRR